jgi:hypothetical protein
VSGAAPTDRPVALVSAALSAPDEVLLRLLDDPALTGPAALVGPPGDGAPADVVTGGTVVQSAGSAVHAVDGADSCSLRAVLIPGPALPGAAPVLAALAGLTAAGAGDGADPLDLALVALVRSGPGPVTAVRSEPFPARRDGGPLPAFDPADALRRAARAGDGFYSTFVLRRLSSRLTPLFVRAGISATATTWLSFLVGVAAAPSFAFGGHAGLVAGAVALQVSLLLDCVDGEIARATRTRSPFGAWLDGATDRVKEYGALAGLAAAGHGLWWLALAGMVVQTTRHLQDAAFDKGVLAEWRSGLRDRRPLGDRAPWTRPPGGPVGPDRLTGPPSLWLRRLAHMPIAERWLVLSVGALLARPGAALATYAALSTLAWLYTLLGAARRTRALAPCSAAMRRRLTRLADLGLLERPVTGGRAAWVWAPLGVLVEGGAVLAAAVDSSPRLFAAAFGWFAVVAWHRYDTVYRGGAQPGWVGVLGLGWPVRSAVLVVLVVASAASRSLLTIGTLYLALVLVPESLAAGVRTARGRRPAARAATAGVAP